MEPAAAEDDRLPSPGAGPADGWAEANGARDELLLAATAQNLRKLARLVPNPE